jgi:myo-inositol-1(or 4)-monophosphatase
MLEKELKTAFEAAHLAGDILKQMAGGPNPITKKGEIDLVTKADIRSEKAVVAHLSNHFPKDAILTEESEGKNGSSGRTWILDPLDGTTNFAHGFPFYAVSIALMEQDTISLGVVFNPVSCEAFRGVRGQGAYLNNAPIKVSQTQFLEDSLLATGFPYDIHQKPDQVLHLFRDMTLRSRGVRRAGSAALDLCFVAAGRFDGFWEEKLHPWDTAAGALIVEEAGGVVTSFKGGAYNPWDKTITAGNPVIHKAMLEILSLENA